MEGVDVTFSLNTYVVYCWGFTWIMFLFFMNKIIYV